MPTVEDIERKQKLLSFLFKVFIALLILIACLFAGWLISYIGYAAGNPSKEEVSLLIPTDEKLVLQPLS
ncbi:MAG: hypothetical protein JXA28_01110 [Bacteroidetes bacterium]|nr:hypothetical protein [Bacteroidota bacterium]